MSNTNIEKYLNDKFEFRYNEISNTMEFRKKGVGDFQEMKEYELNTIIRELRFAGHTKIKKVELVEILKSDFAKSYNPFKEYFEGLQPWIPDDTDYIQALADTVNVPLDEKENWSKWLRKWIMGVVASAIEDNVVNQTCLVLAGKQGIGKTTWLRKLIPARLKGFFYSGSINPGNKDTEIQLAENLIINLDELENLGRKNIASLKEIITKPHVKVRRPYGTNSENMPRRASFTGSVNNLEFLKDHTGTRRFLCFNPQEIDFGHSIDMDKVYAQALYHLRSGEPHYFTKEETAMVNEHNEKYKQTSVEEELLISMFTPHAGIGEAEVEKETIPLLEEICSNSSLAKRLSPRSLGMALHKLNWPTKKIGGRRHWLLNRSRVQD